MQSAFLLPDLYVGYTSDFNRATSQNAMEVTEKQVFQPERESLAWVLNNRILNEYNFRYVKLEFDEPDITNPDDIQKILNITERAGGLTPNIAKEYTYQVIGKDGVEDYDGEWGNIPIAYARIVSQSQINEISTGTLGDPSGAENTPVGKNAKRQGQQEVVTAEEMGQLDLQIQKASADDPELVPIMKEIRNALVEAREKAGE